MPMLFSRDAADAYMCLQAGMIPIQMELGGKDACIVCADADLELASKNVVKVSSKGHQLPDYHVQEALHALNTWTSSRSRLCVVACRVASATVGSAARQSRWSWCTRVSQMSWWRRC